MFSTFKKTCKNKISRFPPHKSGSCAPGCRGCRGFIYLWGLKKLILILEVFSTLSIVSRYFYTDINIYIYIFTQCFIFLLYCCILLYWILISLFSCLYPLPGTKKTELRIEQTISLFSCLYPGPSLELRKQN